MKIKKVRLQNFRNFADEEFSFCDDIGNVRNFTVLLGDNGTGKTSILEGIVKGFVPIIKSMNAQSGTNVDLSNLDIQFDKRWVSIQLEAQMYEHSFSWSNTKRISASVREWPGSPSKSQKIIKKFISDRFFSDNEIQSVPLVLYYSISRMVVDVPMRSRSSRITNPLNALDNCLSVKNEFRRFFSWFKGEEADELRMIRDLTSAYRSIGLTAVRNAITRMIDGYEDVKIKARPQRMVLVSNDNRDLRVEQLSGGYKAVFSLVADIASRLAQANPFAENPLDCNALVLVDELDLHLHPKWQKTIINDLKNTFPNCQFIISTHSASIVQSLSSEEVINLDFLDKERSGNFKGWSISEIQEHEMGVETSKTNEYEGLKESFEEAIINEDVEEAKSLYFQLIEMIHPSNELFDILQIRLIGLGVDLDDLSR